MQWFWKNRIELPCKAKVSSASAVEIWLGALLFPFKLYVVAAMVGILFLRALWIGNDTVEFYTLQDFLRCDFELILGFLLVGYIISSIILAIGALGQFVHSNRAALWSLLFGVTALANCVWLKFFMGASLSNPYAWETFSSW
jgi:hypothetical protein